MMRLLSICLLLCLSLSACGTKGPLYIPEREYPLEQEKQPAPK